MIAQSFAVKSNSNVLPSRNMIIGNETYEVNGTGLNGLMHDPRSNELNVIPDEAGMVVQPNPASRLNVIGLAHNPCDINNIGQPILRGSNNFNHQLAPPFKPHF